MSKSRKAFTLGEVLLALLIFGALATMMLPNIANVRPDKNKVLFKKGYHTAERIVYEMVNDETLYPISGSYKGFDNTEQIAYMGKQYGSQNDETLKNQKFCKLFADKVNLAIAETDVKCDANGANYKKKTPSFVTSDGIKWYIPYTKFDNENTYYSIYIDVNGDKEPDCKQGDTKCDKPDVFEIGVRSDGKMRPVDEKAKEYLKKNASLR